MEINGNNVLYIGHVQHVDTYDEILNDISLFQINILDTNNISRSMNFSVI